MANAPSPDQCAAELTRLLTAQVEVCKQILVKSRQQQQLVEERKEDDLLSLLTDKQRLIDKHQSFTAQSAPYRQRWEAGARDQSTPEARARVEDAYNALREVLDEIIQLEDASRDVLQKQKGEVSLELGKLQKGKLVNKAYGGIKQFTPPAPPRYSDKKG